MGIVPTLWTHAERERFHRVTDEMADAVIEPTADGEEIDIEEGCRRLAKRFKQGMARAEPGADALTSAFIGFAISAKIEMAYARRRSRA